MKMGKNRVLNTVKAVFSTFSQFFLQIMLRKWAVLSQIQVRRQVQTQV